jgi:hypothetical protein
MLSAQKRWRAMALEMKGKIYPYNGFGVNDIISGLTMCLRFMTELRCIRKNALLFQDHEFKG